MTGLSHLQRTLCLAALSAAGWLLSCSGDRDLPTGTAPGPGGASAGSGTSASATGSGGGGCAMDLISDPQHCGACDNPCPPGLTCEAGECTCAPGVVSPDYATEVAPIFASSCAFVDCHDADGPELDLDLVTDVHAAVVGQPSSQCGSEQRQLVEPGSPDRSYVMDKLLGVRLCGGEGMPPDDALSAERLQLISDWICAGAPM